ncbi:ABC transporter ATP-binding protein [Neolewinella lacunae]|uniref:ABC transporter ATP-binding protein n=1 Tax=Neolewinella lacunae TaxID=1517758 RepID=A0A923T910_9BACT|nr:ABC transporter ATP-binding protein [Neolewinella lacunae]MBC6995094.1 ABC transporter ATP-binding protein [Neolewinella lacunae]MDN3634044.1 ABC transporter ATP-binding protein [Neolewinella lacunae]
MNGIEIENISKSYGATLALDALTFTVQPGERFGLLGPDGAGKSTLFKILTTLLIPDTGRASVAGWDVNKDFATIRRHIGYMPGRFSLYPDLSVAENLNFFATIFGTKVKANYELIRPIYEQIEPFSKRRAGALSGGMKQKLALCCALIHQPKVLFLDEPTTGVDAVSRDEFWVMLGELKKAGITILVSTPYMDEAARCERVALLQTGKILALDTPANVVNAFNQPLWAVRADNYYQLLLDLRQASFTERAEVFGEFIHLTTHTGTDRESIVAYAQSGGHGNIVVEPAKASIEDVFLALM